MNLSSQKKVAAKILKCGESRIWIDPSSMAKVKRAITRRDIRNLIKNDIIRKLPKKKIGKKLEKKKKDAGSRKGSVASKIGKKGLWLKNVRSQRTLLKKLRLSGKIKPGTYRKIYKRIKGGVFRNRQHLLSYLKEHGLVGV